MIVAIAGRPTPLMRPIRSRAEAIVAWRADQGGFVTREQLLKVKGVGPKVFLQCAGFLRLRGGAEPLDGTQVHPESYGAARQLLELAGAEPAAIGSPGCTAAVARLAGRQNMGELARRVGVGEPTLQLLLEALQQGEGWDLRAEAAAPLFKSGMTRLEDVRPDATLTGRVANVTHFGAFVDVGVGRDGLVHSSKMWRAGPRGLELGQRVEVKVLTVEVARSKIGLELLRVL